MPRAANGIWYDRTGAGEPVVLLHQAVVDSRIWSPVIPALAERFDVVAYDQRGYGRSDGWDGPYSHVDDLVGVLDQLELPRVALVGASRGGRIAVDAAVSRPERVSALALLGAGLSGHSVQIEGTPEQEERWERAEADGDVAGMAELDMEIWASLGADEELRAMFLENAEVSNADDPAVPIDPPAAARVEEIAVPTLVLSGDHDLPAINAVSDVLEQRIPGAQRLVVPKADHMIQWRAPEQVAAALIAFLTA